MTKPRQLDKGATYMLTRRCLQRECLLKPSPETNQLVKYCMAVAAERTNVQIHAFMVMGNHYHKVATDVDAQLPEFMHSMNMTIAKRLNERYGRAETFWAPGSYSAVRLGGRNDVMAKIVYTLQNPVAAGLVSSYEQWPGAFSRPAEMLGTTHLIERPKAFFGDNSSLPEIAKLTIEPPPNVGSAQGFIDQVEQLLEVVQSDHRQRIASSGKRFVGRRRLRKQRHTHRPQSEEAQGRINPRIAAKDKWQRIAMLQDQAAFYRAYEEARLQLKQKRETVEFPPGSYWLVRNIASAVDTS